MNKKMPEIIAGIIILALNGAMSVYFHFHDVGAPVDEATTTPQAQEESYVWDATSSVDDTTVEPASSSSKLELKLRK